MLLLLLQPLEGVAILLVMLCLVAIEALEALVLLPLLLALLLALVLAQKGPLSLLRGVGSMPTEPTSPPSFTVTNSEAILWAREWRGVESSLRTKIGNLSLKRRSVGIFVCYED